MTIIGQIGQKRFGLLLLLATAAVGAWSCLDSQTQYCGGDDHLRCPTGYRCIPGNGNEWTCQSQLCGDGVVSDTGDEQCDNGGEESATCDVDCTLPVCGDGYTNIAAGETCDDGNTDDDDLCSETCQANIIPTTLAAGGDHVCALVVDETSDARVSRCWGRGLEGQLDGATFENIGDDEMSTDARAIELDGAVKQVAAGGFHTCALLESGCIRCWGQDSEGQLLNNKESDDCTKSEKVKQLAAGGLHTCALLVNGKVRCWGEGSDGQLGYGNTDSVFSGGGGSALAGFEDVRIGDSVVQIVAGAVHTCALLDSGEVLCWGANDQGQLGYGNTNSRSTYETPESVGQVQVGARVKRLAAGHHHTCALLDSGDVRCWGRGSEGQLGYGNSDNVGDNESPKSVGNVPVFDGDDGDDADVIGLAAGGRHTCALLRSGSVRCWGQGFDGQLGNGCWHNIGDNEAPHSQENDSCSKNNVDIAGNVKALAAGAFHTCALAETGAIHCWGDGQYGQLGNGASEDSASPIAVDLGGSVVIPIAESK